MWSWLYRENPYLRWTIMMLVPDMWLKYIIGNCLGNFKRGCEPLSKLSLAQKEQELSLAHSSLVNKAYSTLMQPVMRAEYLLAVRGAALTEQEVGGCCRAVTGGVETIRLWKQCLSVTALPAGGDGPAVPHGDYGDQRGAGGSTGQRGGGSPRQEEQGDKGCSAAVSGAVVTGVWPVWGVGWIWGTGLCLRSGLVNWWLMCCLCVSSPWHLCRVNIKFASATTPGFSQHMHSHSLKQHLQMSWSFCKLQVCDLCGSAQSVIGSAPTRLSVVAIAAEHLWTHPAEVSNFLQDGGVIQSTRTSPPHTITQHWWVGRGRLAFKSRGGSSRSRRCSPRWPAGDKLLLLLLRLILLLNCFALKAFSVIAYTFIPSFGLFIKSLYRSLSMQFPFKSLRSSDLHCTPSDSIQPHHARPASIPSTFNIRLIHSFNQPITSHKLYLSKHFKTYKSNFSLMCALISTLHFTSSRLFLIILVTRHIFRNFIFMTSVQLWNFVPVIMIIS